MKKKSIAAVLIVVIAIIIIQSILYSRVGEKVISSPVMLQAQEDGNFYGIFDGAQNVGFGRYIEHGEAVDFSIYRKRAFFSDEVKSVRGFAVHNDESYVIWDRIDYSTGEYLGQGIEVLKDGVGFPRLEHDYIAEISEKSGYELENLEFMRDGKVYASGVNQNQTMAVYLEGDSESFVLSDRISFAVEGGVNKSFTCNGEKYALSLKGVLYKVNEEGLMEPVSGENEFIRLASTTENGEVVWLDDNTKTFAIYKNDRIKRLDINVNEMVIRHSVEIVEFSFFSENEAIFKVVDENSGDIYFVNMAGNEDFYTISGISCSFAALLGIVLQNNLWLIIIG
ncbi:MAG: hypothetical protein IJC39_00115, partial [Firmicutes bacterium]|nr:hypothetical protein [Bacillota bacterium]